MTPKNYDATKEFNNNLKLPKTKKGITKINLNKNDLTAGKQTDLRRATLYHNNNLSLLLKAIKGSGSSNNTSIKASNGICNLIGKTIKNVSNTATTTIYGFKQHYCKQNDKATTTTTTAKITVKAGDTTKPTLSPATTTTSEGGSGGWSINNDDVDNFHNLATTTNIVLVNEQLKTITNDVSKEQQKMETNSNEHDYDEERCCLSSSSSRIMLFNSPNCLIKQHQQQLLYDNGEFGGESAVTVKPSLLQNFNNRRLRHKNITIKPFSDSYQRTVDLETTSPQRNYQCELLESTKYPTKKDLLVDLEKQTDCYKTETTTLAERKALLKKEFFKDLTEKESEINISELKNQVKLKNLNLNKRVLKKQHNLKLKITKENCNKPQLPKEFKQETCQNSQLSLVALRKLDLQKQSQLKSVKSETRKHFTNPHFPRVKDLAKKFDFTQSKMIVPQTVSEQQKKMQEVKSLKTEPVELRHSPMSDEGCNLGQSPYSSDDDNDSIRTTNTTIERILPGDKRKDKVARSASSDSALGLEVDEPMDVSEQVPQKRRMTLTVTDLPLRPALLPLAEPTMLPDSPTVDTPFNLPSSLQQAQVPTKVLLEERVIEIPEDPRSGGSSRRESSQSCFSDYPASEMQGVRFVRTPSVVVSDYSDDITCGITLEEIEYFRNQRLRRRRSSLDTAGAEKDAIDNTSDISASSSCSNLYYCGSTISALDGAECLVNGIRLQLERKSSDCSNFSTSGDEDCSPSKFTIPEQPEDCQDITDMLANQHLSNKRSKKVGISGGLLSVDNPNFV